MPCWHVCSSAWNLLLFFFSIVLVLTVFNTILVTHYHFVMSKNSISFFMDLKHDIKMWTMRLIIYKSNSILGAHWKSFLQWKHTKVQDASLYLTCLSCLAWRQKSVGRDFWLEGTSWRTEILFLFFFKSKTIKRSHLFLLFPAEKPIKAAQVWLLSSRQSWFIWPVSRSDPWCSHPAVRDAPEEQVSTCGMEWCVNSVMVVWYFYYADFWEWERSLLWELFPRKPRRPPAALTQTLRREPSQCVSSGKRLTWAAGGDITWLTGETCTAAPPPFAWSPLHDSKEGHWCAWRPTSPFRAFSEAFSVLLFYSLLLIDCLHLSSSSLLCSLTSWVGPNNHSLCLIRTSCFMTGTSDTQVCNKISHF